MNDKRVTIYDVAAKCGMSVATVSRVLSKADYAVSEKTRKLVRETAEEMGYQPNFLGRFLKSNTTNDIAVLIPNISHYQHSAMIEGIHHAMANSGYNTLISFSYYNTEYEKEQFQSFLQKRVKGIILVSGSTDTSWLKDMPLQGTPVVALETRLSIAAPYVGFDYYESGKLAAEHLLSLGHRRIGVISSAYIRGNRRERLDGFVDTMRQHGIELTNKDIRVGDNVRGDGSGEVYILGQMMTDLLLENDPPPTAIYAINDTLALGALRTLEAVGIRSPEEISVLGFGNTVQSQTCTPALSTIDQRAFEMGAAATEMLLRLFDDPAAEQSDKIFRPRLLLRETTGPVR